MSLALSLSAFLLILLGNAILLYQQRSIHNWSQRRIVQLAILTMPTLLLLLNLCMFGIISWRFSPASVLLLGGAGIAGMAVVLAFLRLFLLHWTLRRQTRQTIMASVALQQQVEHIIQQGQMVLPRVPHIRIAASQRPLAFTYGFRQPTIVLSTWMLHQLDARELETVLAHELIHAVRHDALVMWLATLLRDAFFYLPTSWLAYGQLQREKELACDEQAAQCTHRPLALAGALTKVWLHALDSSSLARSSLVQSLMQAKESLQGRIERLLVFTPSERVEGQTAHGASRSTMRLLLTMGTIYGSYCLLMFIAMHCESVAVFIASPCIFLSC